jgi:hypothetical protein
MCRTYPGIVQVPAFRRTPVDIVGLFGSDPAPGRSKECRVTRGEPWADIADGGGCPQAIRIVQMVGIAPGSGMALVQMEVVAIQIPARRSVLVEWK